MLYVAIVCCNNKLKIKTCKNKSRKIYISFLYTSNFYQIAHLGDDDGEPEFSSAIQLEEGETFFFAPRPLKNLVMVDELESLSPILTAKVCAL